MTGGVVLIGVGNPWRGDDGVGWAVVEAAREHLRDDEVEVVLSDGEASRLLEAWDGADLAIVVDAMRNGAAVGTLRLWDDQSALPESRRSHGTHGIGVGHAVSLGRALDRMPTRLAIVGIEIKHATHGRGLSPDVASAVSGAVELVVQIVQAGSRATSSAGE